jgi:hypothetical protein
MRSSVVFALVCVGAVLGCRADEPDPSASESPASQPTPTGPPIGSWVVFDERSGFFKTTNTEAGRVPIVPFDDPARLWVAEVVAIHGEFLEVRTITGLPGSVCATNRGVERDYQLRFFIQPEALQRVLIRPKQFEFEDGSSLELEPGVPVLETGELGRVRVGLTHFVVPIADEDVGRWFPAPPSESTITLPHVPYQPKGELLYGEHGFVPNFSPFLAAHETRVVEGRRWATFVNPCGRFVLRNEVAPPGEIPQMQRQFDPDMAVHDAGVLGIVPRDISRFLVAPHGGHVFVDEEDIWGPLSSCKPLRWHALMGTELSWLNGGEAGLVTLSRRLPSEAKERGDRVCFAASDLDLCIETARLERIEADCP